jgi:hypothetical protein
MVGVFLKGNLLKKILKIINKGEKLLLLLFWSFSFELTFRPPKAVGVWADAALL